MSANEMSGLSLLDEVLLAYGMQMLVCALVLVMLVGLVRRRPGRYVNWWIASWASCLVYLATAALALTAVGRMGLPASDWRRIAMSALSLVAGLLQPACMAFGSWECAHDRPIAARRRRLFLTAIVVFGVTAAVGRAAPVAPGHPRRVRGRRLPGVGRDAASPPQAPAVGRSDGLGLGRRPLRPGATAHAVLDLVARDARHGTELPLLPGLPRRAAAGLHRPGHDGLAHRDRACGRRAGAAGAGPEPRRPAQGAAP